MIIILMSFVILCFALLMYTDQSIGCNKVDTVEVSDGCKGEQPSAEEKLTEPEFAFERTEGEEQCQSTLTVSSYMQSSPVKKATGQPDMLDSELVIEQPCLEPASKDEPEVDGVPSVNETAPEVALCEEVTPEQSST